jgi:sensor domain CHASE-containing protein
MLPLLLVIGLALVAIVIWLLTRAHREDSVIAQMTPLTREELECQIMAMLAQAGRPLKQAEIAEHLAQPRGGDSTRYLRPRARRVSDA